MTLNSFQGAALAYALHCFTAYLSLLENPNVYYYEVKLNKSGQLEATLLHSGQSKEYYKFTFKDTARSEEMRIPYVRFSSEFSFENDMKGTFKSKNFQAEEFIGDASYPRRIAVYEVTEEMPRNGDLQAKYVVFSHNLTGVGLGYSSAYQPIKLFVESEEGDFDEVPATLTWSDGVLQSDPNPKKANAAYYHGSYRCFLPITIQVPDHFVPVFLKEI